MAKGSSGKGGHHVGGGGGHHHGGFAGIGFGGPAPNNPRPKKNYYNFNWWNILIEKRFTYI